MTAPTPGRPIPPAPPMPAADRLANRRLDSGELSVMRFSDGMVAVTAHRCGLHLRPDEARRLLDMLGRVLAHQGPAS
jgi:hypothetical protein